MDEELRWINNMLATQGLTSESEFHTNVSFLIKIRPEKFIGV
jgi:hypothetical protein